MTRPQGSDYAFTKLVVHDLEKQAAYYREVYELDEIARVQGRIGEEPFDEIILGHGRDITQSAIILLRYTERAAPPRGEVILGWRTSDLPTLLERIRAAGGSIAVPLVERPEQKFRVAFAADPEGHLAELVQILA